MSTLDDAWEYLTTVQNWLGEDGVWKQQSDGSWELTNDNILALGIDHLGMTIAAVLLATAVALPLGLLLGHFRRGGAVTVVISNVSRAIPTRDASGQTPTF